MKVRGVFSMSIINRLKSLFSEEKDMEEKNISVRVSVDVKSESSDLNDAIVSGTKTSVPISDVLKKEEVLYYNRHTWSSEYYQSLWPDSWNERRKPLW